MPCGLGISIHQQTVQTLLVDVRTGKICERSDDIAGDDIIGVGVAGGRLTPGLREALRIAEGVPVVEEIDPHHAYMPAVGVAPPSTLVMVLGQNSHLLLNSRVAAKPARFRVVDDGILPGYIGYETSQHMPVFAAPERATKRQIEETALETRRLCDDLRAVGVPVRRFVFTAEHLEPLRPMLQTFADVLDRKIILNSPQQPVLLGAAIRGAIAAGAGGSMSQIIRTMASPVDPDPIRPDIAARKHYEQRYAHMSGLSHSNDAQSKLR